MRRNVYRNVYNAGKNVSTTPCHYCTNTGLIQHAGTGPALGQYIAQVLAQCWTIITPALGQYSMPVLGQHWANTLRKYWPNAGPLLPQHWANTACRYWASTMRQHWPNAGPALGQYHMLALARYTAAVQCMYWANAIYTGLPVLARYWPNTVMLAGKVFFS